MESQIWRQLPQELLDYILAFLPLKTLFTLRSTSRHFNSLLFTPSFIAHHSSLSSNQQPLSSFLLLSHPHFLRHFPLLHLPSSSWRLLPLPSPSPSSSLLSAASSSGLLCFSLPSTSSFLITNLLSKSSKLVQFPSHPHSRSFHSLSLISSNSTNYKIFALSSHYSSVFLYDSAAAPSWRQFPCFEPILRQTSHQEGVFYKGYVNFTTPEPYSIVGFNLESGTWETLVEDFPSELTFVRLVTNGREDLYLIGGVGRHGISRGLKVWERVGSEWVEVGRLPELMSKKFMSVCYHNYDHVYCFYHDGLICVCCYTWPEVLYFKLLRQTWHWITKCPSLPEKWSCGFKWFSFVPSLQACV
ncbi:hypothetical protein Syun_005227 [Stephania yunnanensis]|uniref:F-box domain-containing protein n=1 Tax=Stephania yunnanensis TaxID=152371 RepID=A0AAP0L700_9MAGN